MDLKKIIKIFPDWPSEYDEAKQSSSWFVLAQEYYCAALILNDEIEKNRKLLHSQKDLIVNDEIAIRLHGHTPSIFCFAFAIELLIKALYVRDIAGPVMLPNKKLDFSNHKISNLVKEINILQINAEEYKLIKKIESIVVSGKYPTGICPSDSRERDLLPSFSNFKLVAQPLYSKLMTLVTKQN